MLGSDRVLSRRQERFDMKNKGRPSRIDIRADNGRFGPSQRLKGAVYMVEPGSLRTLANGEVREYYLSIGICMPFSLAILLAAVYLRPHASLSLSPDQRSIRVQVWPLPR